MRKVTKGVLRKALRLARGTALALGLAVALALVLGTATTALAGTGVGAVFNLGKLNSVNVQSILKGATSGALLKLENAAGPAAWFATPAGKTPFYVTKGSAKVDNLDADKIDGKDSTEFAQLGGFKASEVIDVRGTLPKEGTFTSNGGTLLISAAGSGFRSSTNTTNDAGRIGMRVMIDGQHWEGVETYTNEADSHKAFVSNNFVVTGLGAGTHTIRLESGWDGAFCGTANEHDFSVCTTTDSGDNFNVSVLEIPN